MPHCSLSFAASRDQLVSLKARSVFSAGDAQSVADLVAFAWYMRQSDTAASEEVFNYLLSSRAEWVEKHAEDRARIFLVGAECARLRARLATGLDYLSKAMSSFIALNDDIGTGDCLFLLAEFHILKMELKSASKCLVEAISHYEGAGDHVRVIIAKARLAFQESYNDAEDAWLRWQVSIEQNEADLPPLALAYIRAFRGHIAMLQGDYPRGIRICQEGLDYSLEAEFPHLSCGLAVMIGVGYANLNDLPTALEWKERAHGIAIRTGWPEVLGATLASMAETMTSLGQCDRAHSLFEAALPHLSVLPETRRHSITFNAFGQLLLAMGKPADALNWLEKASAISKRLGHPDLERALASTITNTLVRLGQLDKAERTILPFANIQGGNRNNPYYEIEALRALGAVRRAQDKGDSGRAIEVLEKAVAIGDSLDGLTVRSEIYLDLSRDYEAMGQFDKALACERRARESWQKNFDRQNGARIQALQVRFDTARAKAEMEHHRKLAEAEAARAAELARSSQVLERLGAIGQEITARLDGEAVFATLARHLHELMQANTLFLGLKDDAKQIIDIRYRMEDGVRLPKRQVALASDNLSARCVRNNEEILVAWDEYSDQQSVPGTRAMRTVLFRPLTLGDKVLGVVSVQSDQPDAYGPRELLIFRTICAYGAIAMANAEAYHQLDRAVGETQEALQRLVQQEKMAALGQLVAGVAHEVNTPLGVTLSAVSQLNDNLSILYSQIEKGSLTRSSLTESLHNGRELADLAQRNVTRAADMIRTFKGVAVDHGNDERRVFDLAEYLSEVMSLIRARVVGYGNKIDIDVPSIEMDSYPGALSQAITNLVANVADHAYSPERPGIIQVRGQAIDPHMVEIAVIDHGAGIAPDILSKVFDPFFTTRRATGSMGLGLHVAFNQVTQRLGGSITIESAMGQGTVAVLRIPCEVPGGISAGIGAVAGKGVV